MPANCTVCQGLCCSVVPCRASLRAGQCPRGLQAAELASAGLGANDTHLHPPCGPGPYMLVPTSRVSTSLDTPGFLMLEKKSLGQSLSPEGEHDPRPVVRLRSPCKWPQHGTLPGASGKRAGTEACLVAWLTHGDFQSFSSLSACLRQRKYKAKCLGLLRSQSLVGASWGLCTGRHWSRGGSKGEMLESP